MTLEEAKEVLRQDINFYDAVDEMAIDTVLKALEDSIPKDEVRKKIDELELLKKVLPIRTEIPRFIGYLKELLGE